MNYLCVVLTLIIFTSLFNNIIRFFFNARECQLYRISLYLQKRQLHLTQIPHVPTYEDVDTKHKSI